MQERENLADLSAVEARFAMMSRSVSPAERKLLTTVWTAPSETLLPFVLGVDPQLAIAAMGELKKREKSPKFPLDPKRLTEVLAQCVATTTDRRVRTSAALALAEHNDSRSIPVLRTLLTPLDKRPLHEGAVPLRAAFLLARFKDTASFPKMRQLGPQLEDSTKRHFADLLCMMADPASIALLGELLKNPYQGTRCHAAIAVGKRKARRFVPKLTALLSDTHAAVRRDAAWALAAIGDKQAIPALQRALTKTHDTRDGLMIQAALDTLKKGQAIELARNPLGDLLRPGRF